MLGQFLEGVLEQGVKLVMYGNAHVQPTGKSEVLVPVEEVAESAKRYVRVLLTPERKTTKLCAGCWGGRRKGKSGGV